VDLEMGRIINKLRGGQSWPGEERGISGQLPSDLRAQGFPIPADFLPDGGGAFARRAALVLDGQLWGIEDRVRLIEECGLVADSSLLMRFLDENRAGRWRPPHDGGGPPKGGGDEGGGHRHEQERRGSDNPSCIACCLYFHGYVSALWIDSGVGAGLASALGTRKGCPYCSSVKSCSPLWDTD